MSATMAERDAIEAIFDKTAPLDSVTEEVVATYEGDAKAAIADLIAIVGGP